MVPDPVYRPTAWVDIRKVRGCELIKSSHKQNKSPSFYPGFFTERSLLFELRLHFVGLLFRSVLACLTLGKVLPGFLDAQLPSNAFGGAFDDIIINVLHGLFNKVDMTPISGKAEMPFYSHADVLILPTFASASKPPRTPLEFDSPMRHGGAFLRTRFQ